MKHNPILNSSLLKELGVLDWGYTEEALPRSLNHFEKWTEGQFHGPLQYLNDHRKDLRRDLRNVFPEFQSALVFLFSYQTAKKWMIDNNEHSVAAYTLGFEGEDYHRALKIRLDRITESLNLPDLKVFHTLDAQPVLERDLAYRAGLGWFGKNSMLISRKEGSYFIIGSLLLNQKLPLETEAFDTDHCGQCTACAEACPTNAINIETRTIEAAKCISTYTIEIFKEQEPPQGFDQSRGEVFGCDICQDVCPWNRKPLTRVLGELKLKDQLSFLKEWIYFWPKETLKSFIEKESNRGFRKKLFGTPFDRPGKEGWLKNLKIRSSQNALSKKSTDEE
jgi:epoxyqueuosine reductase